MNRAEALQIRAAHASGAPVSDVDLLAAQGVLAKPARRKKLPRAGEPEAGRCAAGHQPGERLQEGRMTDLTDAIQPPRLSRWARFLAFFADLRQAWRDLSDPFDVEI